MNCEKGMSDIQLKIIRYKIKNKDLLSWIKFIWVLEQKEIAYDHNFQIRLIFEENF